MTVHVPFPRSFRACVAATATLGLLGVGLVATAGAAAASAPAQVSADVVGEVTAEPTDGLPPDGAVVTVTGTGFDTSAGIYVAVCVDNGPGVKPSPCIGGADTEGVGGATWISDNPPTYAEGLTVPYGPGGSFEVELPVPMTDEVTGVDCREVACAVTVRYDHLRADDRGADHVIPVTFADGTGADEPAAGESTDEGGAGTAEPTADGPAPEADAAPAPADDAGQGEDGADAGAADGGARTADADTSDGFPVLPVALAGVVVLALVATLLLRRRGAGDGTPAEPKGTTLDDD